ncbi:carboxypeptidase regulatory-like domain-containing protein [Pontibacter sp. 172403-2]|uniref:carboxypeptidase-like regulatory domain-containing protein n=1 Tax=Pontibacter rufus TaxID=2791028 RepID=UPI0018AF882E|nr:carboxypeptidase-like regulatory domain-containing protein [Pontibacter sp. 172403-2]MBF9255499.1 carboxypeptidase regulatory-like domain-containing protein [Pontibacter sp. 172403-2]
MDKLLLLPFALLLSNCSNSKPATSGQEEQTQETEQAINPPQNPSTSISIGGATSQKAQQEQQAPIEQGITGQVLWVSGNQMPSPDAPQSSGKRGIQRTVYVYELTNSSQATTTDGVFHTNIQTKLVTQVTTDAEGNFAVSLPPGKYSLFTKEENGLYANLFDGEMNIFPVEVQKGQVTNVEFVINYKASY